MPSVRRLRLGITLAAALAATAMPAAPASADLVETAESGHVRAELVYDMRGEAEAELRSLEIRRHGDVVQRIAPVTVGRDCLQPSCLPRIELTVRREASLTIRDLDGDSEPEVLLDLWSGGNHCCHVTLLLRWDGSRYVRTVRNWTDPGYRLRQLDRDPELELISADARFGYRFGPFAFSRMPVQILALRSGRLVDVTREHPDELRRDRRRALQEWQTARKRRYGADAHRGLAAAWAADSYRLDGRTKTLRQLRRYARRGEFGSRRAGQRYVADLDRFLVRLGYHRR